MTKLIVDGKVVEENLQDPNALINLELEGQYADCFAPLSKDDIDEKFEINHRDWGYDLLTFKEKLEDELFQHERIILKVKNEFANNKNAGYQLFMETVIPLEIQSQNLKEQIAHITNRILREIHDKLSGSTAKLHDENK